MIDLAVVSHSLQIRDSTCVTAMTCCIRYTMEGVHTGTYNYSCVVRVYRENKSMVGITHVQAY